MQSPSEAKTQLNSKKENIDTSTPTGKFMLTVFGAVAELDRAHILQRQAEGIAVAKQNSTYMGRRKIVSEKFEKSYREWKSDHITAAKAMELLGMKR